MTETTATRYIVREIDGKFTVETVQETKHQAEFCNRANAEAYAEMRNEMRAKEAPPAQPEWQYRDFFREIRDPNRGVIARPTSAMSDDEARWMTAAPEMLAALKSVAEWVNNPFDGNAPSINLMRKNINAAIAKAEGRS